MRKGCTGLICHCKKNYFLALLQIPKRGLNQCGIIEHENLLS